MQHEAKIERHPQNESGALNLEFLETIQIMSKIINSK
jgi:hypothetical protein